MAIIGNIVVNFLSDTGGLERGAKKAQSSLSGLRSATSAIATGFAGYAAADFLGEAAMMASDLRLQIEKADLVFGPAAAGIKSQADQMADSLGVVKQEYIGAATAFGSAFKSAGFAADEAARKGTQLTDLGMAMAKFGNAAPEEAFDAISAALRGEFDPLERFGVALTADKVKAEALASGLAGTGKEVDDLAKKQATYNLIVRDSADAQALFAKHLSSTASESRKLAGEWANFKTSFGEVVEGPLGGFLAVVNDEVRILQKGLLGEALALSALERAGAGASQAVQDRRAAFEAMFGTPDGKSLVPGMGKQFKTQQDRLAYLSGLGIDNPSAPNNAAIQAAGEWAEAERKRADAAAAATVEVEKLAAGLKDEAAVLGAGSKEALKLQKAIEAGADPAKVREMQRLLADRDASEKAADLKKELDGVASGLLDQIGALKMGENGWRLMQLAMQGANEAQLADMAGMMRQTAVLEAQKTQAREAAEAFKELTRWHKEHAGITDAAEAGSQDALTAVARHRGQTAMPKPPRVGNDGALAEPG